MKPFKSLAPLASWLLRLSVFILVFQKYADTLTQLKIQTLSFYISLIFVLSSIGLLVGGILKNSGMTIMSGLLIVIFSILLLFFNGFSFDSLLRQMVLISLGTYFLTNGNS